MHTSLCQDDIWWQNFEPDGDFVFVSELVQPTFMWNYNYVVIYLFIYFLTKLLVITEAEGKTRLIFTLAKKKNNTNKQTKNTHKHFCWLYLVNN